MTSKAGTECFVYITLPGDGESVAAGKFELTRDRRGTPLGLLEGCVREHLNDTAPRRFAVLDPLKIVIETYPEGKEEWLEAANHPNRPELGARKVPFAREILIDRFGLATGTPMTLESIGQRLGVTRERVRQIEMSALHKLRRRLEARGVEWPEA